MKSNCCGSNIISPDSEGFGRCAEYKEMCSPERIIPLKIVYENKYLEIEYKDGKFVTKKNLEIDKAAEIFFDELSKRFDLCFRQEKLKAIDEKIEIYKNILKRFIKEGHDQCYIENKIKDLKEQKNF